MPSASAASASVNQRAESLSWCASDPLPRVSPGKMLVLMKVSDVQGDALVSLASSDTPTSSRSDLLSPLVLGRALGGSLIDGIVSKAAAVRGRVSGESTFFDRAAVLDLEAKQERKAKEAKEAKKARQAEVLATRLAKQAAVEAEKAAARENKRKATEEAATTKAAERAARPPKKQKGAPNPPAACGATAAGSAGTAPSLSQAFS